MHWMGISDLTHANYRPLMQVNADAAALIVQQDAPWKTIQDLVDHIKANPGKLQMSGTATGGAWDLARAGWQLAAGLPVEAVPVGADWVRRLPGGVDGRSYRRGLLQYSRGCRPD